MIMVCKKCLKCANYNDCADRDAYVVCNKIDYFFDKCLIKCCDCPKYIKIPDCSYCSPEECGFYFTCSNSAYCD